MLNEGIIKQNEVLKSLTPEQINAITTLSQNDENQAIAKKIGEIHGQYDKDIFELTGKEKPKGLKTYDWLKQQMTAYKTGASQTAVLQEQVNKLQEQLKAGAGNEALTAQINDLSTKVKEWENKYQTDTNEYQGKLKKEQNRFTQLQIDNEFSRALQGVKFKDEGIIPVPVRDAFLKNAKQNLLSQKPEWIDDGKGGQRLVFRNEQGQILNNPENALNPFTAKELLLKSLSDIIDKGKQQQGAGTGQQQRNTGSLDLTGVKNQVDADDAIATHIMKTLGLRRGTAQFAAKQAEIRKTNNVSSLPIR